LEYELFRVVQALGNAQAKRNFSGVQVGGNFFDVWWIAA
jgi:hypothetical protein